MIRNCKQLKNPEDFQIITSSGEDRVVAEKEMYREMFGGIMANLKDARFGKIVLSRIKKADTNRSAGEIFEDLNTLYFSTYNYLLSSELTGTWIGASPELLLEVKNTKLQTVSLAGTRPTDLPFDWTDKEIREQQLVTDFIADSFQKNGVSHIHVSPCKTVKAGPVEHLKTEISGQLTEQTDVNSLVSALHPTPATCGVPKSDAMQVIQDTETHKRRLYTGYLGIRLRDRQIFFVNLRCMEYFTDHALLYLGGGILSGSDLDKEWEETEKKAQTLLKAL